MIVNTAGNETTVTIIWLCLMKHVAVAYVLTFFISLFLVKVSSISQVFLSSPCCEKSTLYELMGVVTNGDER